MRFAKNIGLAGARQALAGQWSMKQWRDGTLNCFARRNGMESSMKKQKKSPHCGLRFNCMPMLQSLPSHAICKVRSPERPRYLRSASDVYTDQRIWNYNPFSARCANDITHVAPHCLRGGREVHRNSTTERSIA
jgi:hypothetical protein